MFLMYFALLLVVLVLVHEFGHFIVARWMGVRVLSFSIGFGPTVVAWKRGHTEYAIRALPLGGFVRMLGDDPSAPPDAETANHPEAFTNKPVWRRALIVAAGPLANFVLPVVILFFGSLLLDGMVVSTRLGTVLPDGPAAQAGLRAGDRLLTIADVPVQTFDDLKHEMSARPGKKVRVVFDRDGKQQALTLTPSVYRQVRVPELGLIDTVGRIEVRPDAQNSVVAVQPGSLAWQAGLRSGDRVTAVGKLATPSFYAMDKALTAALARREPVTLQVRSMRSHAPVARMELLNAFDHQHEKVPYSVVLPAQAVQVSAEAAGLTPAQLVVGPIEKASPVDTQIGLQSGDQLLAIDGVPARSFIHLGDVLKKPYEDVRSDPANRGLSSQELVAKLRTALAQPHVLTVRHEFRSGEVEKLRVLVDAQRKATTPLEQALLATPDPKAVLAQGWFDRQAALKLEVAVGKDERPALSFGANAATDYEDAEKVPNPNRLAYAVRQTQDKMAEAVQVTVLTVAGLFRGHVPMKEVGGPIFMAQLASKTADLGWGYFFELMVWLSINLAILNLLPIPLVDGGHLLFLAIEAIKREPVSLRTRQVAAYIGMSFLGLLFVVVMKNDTQRALPDVIDWARKLMQ